MDLKPLIKSIRFQIKYKRFFHEMWLSKLNFVQLKFTFSFITFKILYNQKLLYMFKQKLKRL